MSAKGEKLVSFKDLYAKRREHEAPRQEESQPSPGSLPGDNSLVPETIAYRPGSLPAGDRLPGDGRLAPDMWAPFRDKRGHFQQPHAYTDGLCQLLDVYEQAVFTQLYRLSRGFNKATCKIGLPQLARRANVGKTSAQGAVTRLVAKGLVRKIEAEFGRNREQGTTYWVSSPDSLPGDDSLPGAGSNKIKALKENNKKGAHARKDYSNCPDCSGTGMWYPDGYEKGVSRCRHEKLRK